jgi:hypothetical protein
MGMDVKATRNASAAQAASAVHYPSNIDPKVAKEFSDALKGLNGLKLDSTFAATTVNGSPVIVEHVPYKVKISPLDIGGPQADKTKNLKNCRDVTVLLETAKKIPDPDNKGQKIDGSRSVLSSFIDYVTPSLTVKNDPAGGKTFNYVFTGAAKDLIEISTDKNGHPTFFSFSRQLKEGEDALRIYGTTPFAPTQTIAPAPAPGTWRRPQ